MVNIYHIEYKTFDELINILPNVSQATDIGGYKKFYTDYDVLIIYDSDGQIIGAYTDDLIFANTIRQYHNEVEKYQNLFTFSIRCVIINWNCYMNRISLEELESRYSIKI